MAGSALSFCHSLMQGNVFESWFLLPGLWRLRRTRSEVEVEQNVSAERNETVVLPQTMQWGRQWGERRCCLLCRCAVCGWYRRSWVKFHPMRSCRDWGRWFWLCGAAPRSGLGQKQALRSTRLVVRRPWGFHSTSNRRGKAWAHPAPLCMAGSCRRGAGVVRAS